MPWRKRPLRRSARRIQELVEIGHRVDRLIAARILTSGGMLHPAERLILQDDPGAGALFEVVSDLHPATWRAVLRAKLDFRVRPIASDGNATHIHVHGTHIQRADGSQVLQNSGANGVGIARLLFARTQAEERDR